MYIIIKEDAKNLVSQIGANNPQFMFHPAAKTLIQHMRDAGAYYVIDEDDFDEALSYIPKECTEFNVKTLTNRFQKRQPILWDKGIPNNYNPSVPFTVKTSDVFEEFGYIEGEALVLNKGWRMVVTETPNKTVLIKFERPNKLSGNQVFIQGRHQFKAVDFDEKHQEFQP